MATCYICGKSHAEYRRSVYTGNSNRVGISSGGRIHTSTTAHYGLRTVCARCALDIDYRKRKNAGNWGIGVGIVLVILSFPFFSIAPVFSYCSLILGSLLGIAPCSIAHKKAENWYKENCEKYIDAYDIQQELKQRQKSIKQLENQNNQKSVFQELGKSFGARIEQEMKLLAAKADLLNATFDNKTINNIEECDKILATLKTLESEANAQDKQIQTLCNDYIKQCKKFDFNNRFIEDFLSSIENVRIQCINTVNEFLSQIKASENQLLQAKITIIESNPHR